MIHVFHGQDEFSQAEALAALKASLGSPEALAANTSRFEAARTTPEEVLLACSALPFLGEQRLVTLEGALAAVEAGGRGRHQEKSVWLSLAQAAPRLPPTTTLVLRDDKVAPGNHLLKALGPVAQVREFPLLRPAALTRWLQERAARRGVVLEADAAHLLADLVGSNLWTLSNELDKLAAYAAGPQPATGTTGASATRSPITAADVQALTPQAREASIFALVDALVEGRRPAALTLLHRALRDGASAQYILAMVARQLRRLVQAKEMLQAGASPQEVGRALGLSQEFAIRRAREQAQAVPFPRLEHLFRLALEADVATKTGLLQETLALDVLFADGGTR
ncbi:MAG: DNA polymerase III subunit delta [Chloroflexi bacterium]|nr:DNA polymerase III subunit delta [Chloroflexota bacterium]